MALRLSSPAFPPGGAIPRRHTCEGPDRSPPLIWDGIPPGTLSLALVVDDPDAPDPTAPKLVLVHWVLYNLPPVPGGLPEAVQRSDLPIGAREGLTDFRRTGWGGPCPPIGRHRYFFRLYSLDRKLPEEDRLTRATVDQAMAGHILATAELMGTYQKGSR